MRPRDLAIAGLVALLVGGGLGFVGFERLGGLSIDLLFWLRHQLYPRLADPAQSPVVVVAIDEETYRTPPFSEIPNALWTPELAGVLNAIIAGGAAVVGFDVIFPTSVERFVPGYDRDFLLALRNGARAGKVVLGKVQHQQLPIKPFAGQSFAVGNQQNIRPVNLFRDGDDVVRRVPLTFESQDARAGLRTDTSMALELASRALGQAAAPAADGGLSLGGRRIPGSERDTMLVNFDDGNGIPTYSLADLQACVEQHKDADFFKQHFAGKVVLIGAVLDVEDRLLTSKRFITAAEGPSAGARCVHPPMANLFRQDVVRDTIPGVYVHASAVNDLLRGDMLAELAPPWSRLLVVGLTLGAAALTMLLAPLAAGAVLVGIVIAWAMAATVAFRFGVVLPLLAFPVAALITFTLLIGFRFAVTDRDKRFLRRSFGFYLAPAVLDRMLAADQPPALGGELRNVTLFFSDIAGFTGLSERLAPAALVALMNEYLTAMTDIIEAEAGLVDKYIGDAIVAVFGAPLDDGQHALHAVRAALACQARLDELNAGAPAFAGHQLGSRIGLATGEALVGNVGSRRRFNYTAMGDTVNLAARLEGANKGYGTAILASEATRQAAGDAVAWREIDRVRVVGRQAPVGLFEPLGLRGSVPPARLALAADFATGLADYRARRFAEAAGRFAALAGQADGPARLYAERAERFRAGPPPDTWDGVTTLELK